MVSSARAYFLILEKLVTSRQGLKGELSLVRVTLQVACFWGGGSGENFPDKICLQILSSDD
jgi:hypothetical protein